MNEQSHIQALSDRLYQRGQRTESARVEPTVGETPPRTQRVAGHYRLSARIGRGRLGEIYEAVDEASSELGVERRVAIQLIDPKIVAQEGVFDDLRRAYAALRAGPHANIVDILDFGRDGEVTFLVMKLLDGASLRFVLDDAAALPANETWAVIRAVGDALQYLHAKGFVYGTLWPENVLITFDYAVKLLDIAPAGVPSWVAYYVEDGDTREPTRDLRDDVYSLACLTYELLSGKHPFNSNSPREAHRAGMRPAPISGLAPGQWRAIASGLALQRGLRTSTVAEFLYELGVQGTERLCVPEEQPEAPLREPPLPEPPTAQARAPAPPRYVDEELVAPPPREPVRRDVGDRRHGRGEVERAARSRTFSGFMLIVVLAGLGALAFLYYEPLRERAAELLARGDGESSRAADEIAAITPENTRSDSATATEAARQAAALPAESRGIEDIEELDSPTRADVVGVPVETSISSADAEPSTVLPEAELPPSEVARDPPAPAPAPVESPATPAAEVPVPAASTAARSEPAGPPFSTPSVVAVAENDAAAVVVVQRGDPGTAASIVWWTSDDTAVADEDYANLGESRENFAPGEEARSLYVPLIGDALPERNESFYVYVGRYDASQRSLEPYSSTRIDIADDD